jgi:hypothetical protein
MNPDQSEIAMIEQRLKGATGRLHQLAAAVGHAKQIREFESDRRKNLLAKYVVKHLKAGESATAAEAYGRSEEAFQTELEALAVDFEVAETTLAKWQAELCSFEASRSLLSLHKETLKTLEG